MNFATTPCMIGLALHMGDKVLPFGNSGHFLHPDQVGSIACTNCMDNSFSTFTTNVNCSDHLVNFCLEPTSFHEDGLVPFVNSKVEQNIEPLVNSDILVAKSPEFSSCNLEGMQPFESSIKVKDSTFKFGIKFLSALCKYVFIALIFFGCSCGFHCSDNSNHEAIAPINLLTPYGRDTLFLRNPLALYPRNKYGQDSAESLDLRDQLMDSFGKYRITLPDVISLPVEIIPALDIRQPEEVIYDILVESVFKLSENVPIQTGVMEPNFVTIASTSDLTFNDLYFLPVVRFSRRGRSVNPHLVNLFNFNNYVFLKCLCYSWLRSRQQFHFYYSIHPNVSLISLEICGLYSVDV